MRFFPALLLCLVLSPVALSQTKPILERTGEVEFGGAPEEEERVIADKLLATENKLVLVGHKIVRVLDILSGKFVESHLLEVPESNEDKPRVISPDGRKLLVFGNYDSTNKADKVKRPLSVWDLRTGKQITVIDKTSKHVREAFWSKNGKTLVTSSDKYAARGVDVTSVEVSFWDGATFEYKSSLPSDKISWSQLSDDGEKCFYTVGVSRNFWILDKYVASTGAPVNVWDISSGKIEQTISVRDGNVERKIRDVDVSPDGKFLTLVTQPPKSKETERRLVIWEIDKSNYPRYEIRQKYELKPAPKISGYGAEFSPDGKYFSLEAGKNVQIYETATGEKKLELPNLDRDPSYWLDDNRILIFYYGNRLEAFEAATGRQLYQQKLIYEWSSYTNDAGVDISEPVDTTTILIHPNRNLFATYSNQYVKLFDSRTGELLQTVVSPPMDYTKKKPRLSDKPLVSKAGWSGDGKTLYILSADSKSISVWRLLEK